MLFSRRNFLSITASGLCAPFIMPHSAGAQERLIRTTAQVDAVNKVETSYPHAAVTFDDGPHPELTPRLLDMLREQNVKATFFVIGRRVVRWPEIVARIADEGHEIGNHSWEHPFLDRMSDADAVAQVDRTSRAIFDATGKGPVTFRPPYGALSTRQRTILAQRRGLTTILWSIDPQDWQRPGATAIANHVLSRMEQGTITLLHDIHPGSVAAVPAIIDGMKARGLQQVTISELMGWTNWSDLRFRLQDG